VKNRVRAIWVASVLLAVAMTVLAAVPAGASTINFQSSTSNYGAETYVFDPGLYTYNASEITDLTFTTPVPVDTGDSCPWACVPNSPAGTQQVKVPGPVVGGNDPSGFIETTFTLPSNYHNASISGLFSVDDEGVVFLNGNDIGSVWFTSYPTYGTYSSFGSSDQSYFQPGTNYLIISDNNTGSSGDGQGGPGGMEFYGTVNYSTTPEPGSLLLLGTGLVGLAGIVRRKLGLRA